MPVSLAVPDIAAADGSQPESVDQFLCGDISPALGDVAFIFAFIVYDRFFIFVAPFSAPCKVRALDTGVNYPGLGVVVEAAAVVDAAHTLVWIVLLNNLEEAVPVRHFF